MIEPTEQDIGRTVVFRIPGKRKTEEGVITSFNDHYVFVRYGDEKHSKATSREYLEFAHQAGGTHDR